MGSASRFLKWLFRGFVTVFVVCMDRFVFGNNIRPLSNIFWGEHLVPDGAIWYFGFMAAVPYCLGRTNRHANKLQEGGRSRTELKILGACFLLMFIVVGIACFSLFAFPNIPVSKGGGNYAASPLVSIEFRKISGQYINTNDPVICGLSESNCYVMIERTHDSLFLANVGDSGGPSNWAKMRKMPKIIEIPDDIVAEIKYTSVVETNPFDASQDEEPLEELLTHCFNYVRGVWPKGHATPMQREHQ